MDDGGAAGARTPAEMRAALRRRAAAARGHARELVAECARLDARYRMQQVRHEPLLASRAELRAPLAESIIGYARELRDLGAQPQDLVVLVKELADDLQEGRADDVDGLRQTIVTWGIEAYYAV